MRHMDEPIAIVGSAASGALGSGVAELVAAIRRDRCGIRSPIALEQSPKIERGAGEVPLDPVAGDDAFRAERLLRGTLDSLLAAAGPGALAADPARNAVVVGTTVGGMRHCGAAIRSQRAGDDSAAMRSFCRTPASTVLRRALHGIPVEGPCVSISCACASALSAIAHGCALLRSAAADSVIVGGYDPISEFVYGGFAALQLIASGPISPFADGREGMKVAEGCALFVLRRLDDAVAGRAEILGVIDGVGESSDAHHLTHPHPEGRGAADALRGALATSTDPVPGLLLAHATGTPGNDSAEYRAYAAVFGACLPDVPVVALKSRLGHPLGAAGALELAIALESSRQGVLPAGSGPPPDAKEFPKLSLRRGGPVPGSARSIACLAAGFGGANVAISVSVPAARFAGDRVRSTRRATIDGWGAVCPAGAGAAGIARFSPSSPASVPDELLCRPAERAKFRRVALLPKLMIAAVRDLAESAGIDEARLARTPVLCATWHGAVDFTERYYRDLIESGIDLANPLLFAESVPNVGSGHVSIGLGITAPCASVIGSRNAGLEALALAFARIESREWDEAIVVAADEAHPLLDAVLGHWSGGPVRSAPAAVAALVGVARPGASPAWARPCSLAEIASASASPLDRPATDAGVRGTAIPECGAATALAVAMLEATHGDGRFASAGSSEPGGSPWALGFHA